MKTKVSVNITEYCDKIENDINMIIDYVEIPRLGVMSSEYKKGGFNCSIGSDGECEYYNKTNHCPIYEEKPITRKDI